MDGGRLVDGGREKSGPVLPIFLDLGSSASHTVMTEDSYGAFAVSGRTVSQASRNSEVETTVGKLCVCVSLVFWLTGHLEPDHLHLSVFHIGLLVSISFKEGVLLLAEECLKTTDSDGI